MDKPPFYNLDKTRCEAIRLRKDCPFPKHYAKYSASLHSGFREVSSETWLSLFPTELGVNVGAPIDLLTLHVP